MPDSLLSPAPDPVEVRERVVAPGRSLVQALVHGVVGAVYRVLGPSRREVASVRRVLLSGYTGLGHFVLKSVLVDQMKDLFEDCSVAIITGEALGKEQILDSCEVITLDPGRSALEKAVFFLRLRRRKFDVILFPADAAPPFLLRGALLAAIPTRVGHVFPDAFVPSYYYTHRVPVRLDGPRSELDMNLDLLEAIHGRLFKRRSRPTVGFVESPDLLAGHGLTPGEYICVQPGAANGNPTTKRWLEGHFSKLFTRLLESHSALSIVALGDTGDAPLVTRVCDGFEPARVKNLAGRTSLDETKTLIAGARLLVCHDSGLLHLGNALGAKVVALYGPSDPDAYAENLESFHLLREDCSCPKQGLFPGLHTDVEEVAARRCPIPKCMEALTVERVFSTCVDLLKAG